MAHVINRQKSLFISLILAIVLFLGLLIGQWVYFQMKSHQFNQEKAGLEELLYYCSSQLGQSEADLQADLDQDKAAAIPEPTSESSPGDQPAKTPILPSNDKPILAPADKSIDGLFTDDRSAQALPALPAAGNNQKQEISLEKAGVYKTVMTTLFWVGETAGADNDHISNHESYWDENWQDSFGGVDDPLRRCGWRPCAFTPKENPFYFALPYGEYDENYDLKKSLYSVPWYEENADHASILKNHWIEIKANGKTAYAQWQDVGPIEMDDFDYVFGTSRPRNIWGAGAGLDISPAAWDYLGMSTNQLTSWRFVDRADVPDGPWLEIVTF